MNKEVNKVLIKVEDKVNPWTYNCYVGADEVSVDLLFNKANSEKYKDILPLKPGSKYWVIINENWINFVEPFTKEKPIEQLDVEEKEGITINPIESVSVPDIYKIKPKSVLGDKPAPYDVTRYGQLVGNCGNMAATLLQGRPYNSTIALADDVIVLRDRLVKDTMEKYWK